MVNSAAPVPPTPPVPLSALLARDDLALRRIAGPGGADVVIHWAHTSEMADPYPYLLGGELLLTAGVQIPDASAPDAFFDAYVARIVAAGGAALGFGLAPVHERVPRALVAACDAHGLPLLEVPPQTTFSAVARAVWQLMAQARLAELRRVTEAQLSLAAAAARPDPVPSVLRRLAQRLGGQAVLHGPDGTPIAAAGREPAPGTREALAELARVVRPAGPAAPSSATDTVGGAHLSAYALGSGAGFVLGVAAGRREAGDHTIASVGVVLLSLLTGEHQSAAGAARSSALVRLLLGAAPETVAPLLGDGDWFVVHASPEPPDPSAAHHSPQPREPGALGASALGAALGSPLVDVAEEVVRVLAPADREPAPVPGWTLGVSAPAAPHEWPAADAQAARALARARAARAPLVRHDPRPGLSRLVPEAEARAHARTLLAPLAARPALLDTLHTWLSLHGSWDRTAVALGVHRNTVRQRIARCALLLDTDLDDADVRMELWFALRHR
ncbi:PucR family transcriptional regulator [Streptomyces sp. F-1]|uniref:PucR family transcriptional regulator n=1 Tax=Streptomyces sp. F-1 TaxID=463642 RepID=UPI00086E719F|nr:PucR family transcriptional regulator [Streptomyces sp. F-1]SFY50414.1 Purine catabolism regulatory protein [Streptomyces sp. F-1]